LALNPKANSGELQFMLGIFMVGGYFAGFLDGRRFIQKDTLEGQKDQQAEQESLINPNEDPSTSQYYFESEKK
jgi:hypothetical protein